MTKAKNFLLLLPALLVLGACSKPAAGPPGNESSPPANALNTAASSPASDAAKAIAVPQLAYDYSYDFAATAEGVDHLLAADQAACDRAGVSECQMVSLTSEADHEARSADKVLDLRVSPAWLKTWQGGLNAELAQLHARIATQKVSSEDLSLQVVDAQAHIANKQALRDRLRADIATHPAKLSDLTDLENQLSQVQEDIDATQSALAVMSKRINTVHLTLHYQSDIVAASDGTFAPIIDAAKGSLGVTIHVIAGIISIASAILPIALLGGLCALLIQRWWRRKPALPAVEKP